MSKLKQYKNYTVQQDELNNNLRFIEFNNYDEAYDIMLDLKMNNYFIHDLEENEEKRKYIVWFS